MPAKKKPAPKAPAKTAKNAPAKAAPQKPSKVATPAPKPADKPVKKAAPQKSPPVKKAPAKTAPKAAAKKAEAKPAPAAKKEAAKAAPAKKAEAKPAPAAKKEATKAAAAPAKKEAAAPVKAAAPAKKAEEVKAAPAKKAGPAPAPAAKAAPAAAPAKAAKPASTPKITNVRRTGRIEDEGITMESPPKKPVLPAAFLKKQRQRLVELRDAYLNSAEGVTAENLRNEGGDASAFGMHQADAGSDAYDRDFALSLLAKEQDAIYEINEALKRIDSGMYGICEMSGETIPEERLEALPFTRFTVTCQERIEREQGGGRWNRPVRSLFGLDETADDVDDDRDEDESSNSSNSNSNESLDFSKE